MTLSCIKNARIPIFMDVTDEKLFVLAGAQVILCCQSVRMKNSLGWSLAIVKGGIQSLLLLPGVSFKKVTNCV